VRENDFRGFCPSCKRPVAPGKGYLNGKTAKGWIVVHKKCIKVAPETINATWEPQPYWLDGKWVWL
jgi:hypothetical protein